MDSALTVIFRYSPSLLLRENSMWMVILPRPSTSCAAWYADKVHNTVKFTRYQQDHMLMHSYILTLTLKCICTHKLLRSACMRWCRQNHYTLIALEMNATWNDASQLTAPHVVSQSTCECPCPTRQETSCGTLSGAGTVQRAWATLPSVEPRKATSWLKCNYQ